MTIDSTNSTIVKLKSSSKINLGLWIKEKRPDGYHELETIFFENTNIYDDVEIEFVENHNLKIEVSFKQDSLNKKITQEDNLAYKSAKLFLESIGKSGICKININKNIPLEAGLGGGSSNAALILKGLNTIFGNILREYELLKLALKLGSDVPFFIIGKTCLGTGRGEILKPIENKIDLDIKIIKLENISVSTKWAYEQIDAREFIANHRNEIDNLILAIKTSNKKLLFKNIFNDFEMVVFSCFPELIKERKKLLDEGYMACGLCGSGSALFGIK